MIRAQKRLHAARLSVAACVIALVGAQPSAVQLRGADYAGFELNRNFGKLAVDTQLVRMRCDTQPSPDFAGVILGRVVNSEHIGIPGAAVQAEWSDDPISPGGEPARSTTYQMTVASALDGSYQFCGVPLDRVVRLRATLATRHSPVQPINIMKPARRAKIDLMVASGYPPETPSFPQRILPP